MRFHSSHIYLDFTGPISVLFVPRNRSCNTFFQTNIWFPVQQFTSLRDICLVRFHISGMERVGLRVLAKRQETIRKDYVSADAFLRTIHEQGLTGGDVSSSERPLTRGELQRLRKEYEARYTNGDTGVFASYKVLYLKATKPILHQG